MKALIITLAVVVIIVIVGLGVFYYTQMAGTNSQVLYNNSQTSQGSNTQTTSTTSEPQDIITTASQSGTYKTFVAVVMQAELQSSLQSGGPYTVFVPTDSAFGKLDQATIQKLVNDKQFLVDVLKNHVVNGTYLTSDLTSGEQLSNLNGTTLTVSSTGDTVMVNGAKITNTNEMASNGVIQGIDSVIISQ